MSLDQLFLGVWYKEGDVTTEDINCGSDYMLAVMPKVDKAIREAFFWVPLDDYVYLVLDSAGGHGTKEAIAKYKADLFLEYKIILVHQVPQSPDTNVLDLGIWMSLQSAVAKMHRLQRGDKEALDCTVRQVWSEVTNEQAFTKVFDRLVKNYDIIRRCGGDNELVEEFRGKKGKAALATYVHTVNGAVRGQEDAPEEDAPRKLICPRMEWMTTEVNMFSSMQCRLNNLSTPAIPLDMSSVAQAVCDCGR